MRTLCGALLLGVAAHPLVAQCGPRVLDRPARRDSLLVTTAWLAAHQADTDLVILQIGEEGFADGHIPGARPVDAMTFSVGNHDLPPVERLGAAVEALGITGDTRVILYGDPWHTGWMFWVLDYVGHGDRTAVLDGGLPQWRAEGRPLERGAVRPRPESHYTPRPRPDVVADAAYIQRRLGRRRLALIDGRSADEYTGASRERPRAGHIPGARHLDWSLTFTNPRAARDSAVASRLVPPDSLVRLLAGAGAGPGSDIVFYCTIGIRAGHLYFVARYLGYAPRMYDGSWAEWSRRADLPVATGPNPGDAP